ncbi:MAG: Si-specific NAD(P)(+) transhydrogenase [Planctomycetota bacterium]
MEAYDLVCLGCGPAGERAAAQASKLGKRVAVIEREVRPGGAMVNTGTLPSKALRETALLCSMFHRRPLPGMELNFDRTMSVPRFMAQRHRLEMEEHDRIESMIDRHNITVLRGHGQIIDANTVAYAPEFSDPIHVRAERILICTGSRPVRPEFIPFDDVRIVDADSVLTLNAMPERMVIVGGGVIGCEYASIFAEINVKVDLVHPRDAVLPWLDPDCRGVLEDTMRHAGVNFRYNASVESVDRDPNGPLRVVLESGESIETDVMLWAAGRAPNTDTIGLDNVNVETTERGHIVVDESFQTSEPTIYAAGDIIGFPALAATSLEQGRIAASAMFGAPYLKTLAETMPVGIYTVPAISCVGLSEADAIKKGMDVVAASASYSSNSRGRMLGDSQGMLKCIFERDSRRIVGATVVGEQATELVHVAQLAISAQVGVEYFVDACFNYPSLTALFKTAAHDFLRQIEVPVSRAA